MQTDRVQVTISLIDRFVEILVYAHPLGFLRPPYRDVLRAMNYKQVDHTYLNSCLGAVKRYFDHLLSLPENSYQNFSTIQWGYLVQAILITSRLTFLMALNMNWSPETARSQVPLVMYLDCLMYRFQIQSSISPRTTEVPKNADMFHIFQAIFASVKKNYEKRVAKLVPAPLLIVEHSLPMSITPGHCPMMDMSLNAYFDSMDPMEVLDVDTSASGTPSTGSSNMTAPLYHDLWATMTGSWAEEI